MARSNPFVGQVMPVQTFQGRLGNVIGRLPDGKVALIADKTPGQGKPLPGEEWDCEVCYYGSRYAIVRPLKPEKIAETVTLTFQRGKLGSPVARLPDGKIAILPPQWRDRIKPNETYECAVAKVLDKFAVVIPVKRVKRIAQTVKPVKPAEMKTLAEPITISIRPNLKLTIPKGSRYMVKGRIVRFEHPTIGSIFVSKHKGSFYVTAPTLSLYHEPITFNPHPPFKL